MFAIWCSDVCCGRGIVATACSGRGASAVSLWFGGGADGVFLRFGEGFGGARRRLADGFCRTILEII